MDEELYVKVCQEIDNWPSWKKEYYEQYFSSSAYSARRSEDDE